MSHHITTNYPTHYSSVGEPVGFWVSLQNIMKPPFTVCCVHWTRWELGCNIDPVVPKQVDPATILSHEKVNDVTQKPTNTSSSQCVVKIMGRSHGKDNAQHKEKRK